MKMKHALSLLLLSLLSLASCNQNSVTTILSSPTSTNNPTTPSTDDGLYDDDTGEVYEEIESAINILRTQCYTVEMTESVTLMYPNSTTYIDIGTNSTTTMNFMVGDEVGISYSIFRESFDISKSDHTTKQNIVYRNIPEVTYFKDEASGCAYSESVTKSNEFSKSYTSQYDEDTGVYEPISYDSRFRNPWDYIAASDVKKNSDGEYILSNQKTQFLLQYYRASNLNWVQKAVLNLDNGKISSITLSTPNQTGTNPSSENYYVRTTAYTLKFSDYGTSKVTHIPEDGYTNDNPELQAIFNNMKTATSYTYKKTFKNLHNTVMNPDVASATDYFTTGYFTTDAVYYAQMYEDLNHDGQNDYTWTYGDNQTNNIAQPYQGTDDYDSIIKKETGDIYYAYQYTPDSNTGEWSWGRVSLSDSTDYSFTDMLSIGPDIGNISASIFKKVEGTANKYEIEDKLLSYAGGFFNNKYNGVYTTYLDTYTYKLELTINADGSLTIDTGYKSGVEENDITFDLYDINSTTLASWMTTQVNSIS